MIRDFGELPDPQRNALVDRYFGRWQGRVEPTSSETAKECVREEFVYALCMFWQARFSKLDEDSISIFDWVSAKVLPEEVGYSGIRYDQLLINSADHKKLAHRVFDELWDIYAKNPCSGFVTEEKQTFTERLIGLFHR